MGKVFRLRFYSGLCGGNLIFALVLLAETAEKIQAQVIFGIFMALIFLFWGSFVWFLSWYYSPERIKKRQFRE